ncbi:MAG: cysteine hydrolase [Glaciimonas sp.]|nr:cysteine hydrolase [Glaciimonas sp.]
MKSALLVIDVQKGCFDPSPHPYEAALVIARINTLTAKARLAGAPVIFVQHEEQGLEYDSENWQLVPELCVKEGDVTCRKTASDAFLRTDLQQQLISWKVEQVIICGYSTQFCVDSTVRCAAALGYSVILVSDAHTCHDQLHASGRQIREHHNLTLSNIGSYGVEIKTLTTANVDFTWN